jgi:hypothetical protein
MDATDPDIRFNSEGICNHCSEFINIRAQHKYKGEETDLLFKALISKIKAEGKGKKYDCIIGLSGGVDSSYVAYLVKKKYGLRTLAVHLDNGWNSEEKATLALMGAALAPQINATAIRGLAAGAYLLPNTFGLANGGMQFGEAINVGSAALDGVAGILNHSASLASTVGQFQRREEDWKFQLKMTDCPCSF